MTWVAVDQREPAGEREARAAGGPPPARPKAEDGVTAAGEARGRSAVLDALRGLAIACMAVDHLVLIFGGPSVLRMTVGRLAVPLFFVLAGYLSRRLSWRLLYVAAAGLALPLVVPWVDAPNVLYLYALGALLLAGLRRLNLSPWLVVVLALTLSANGFRFGADGGYDPWSLWALMAGGQLLWLRCCPYSLRDAPFGWAGRLPRGLALLGRYPLSFYLGHVLVLEAVRRVG